MTLSPSTAGSIQNLSDDNGSSLRMHSNSTASKTVSVPDGISKMTVRAKGEQCAGAPNAIFKIDGTTVHTASVSATTFTNYSSPTLNIPAGSHAISVQYSNDASSGTCSRTLILDQVTLVSSVTPEPTPPPSSVTVSLSGISDNQTVSGTSAPGVQATASTSVASVEFLMDSTSIGSQASAPYCSHGDSGGLPCSTWDSTTLSDGNHTLTAIAKNTAGTEVGRKAVTFEVDNSTVTPPPPTSSTRGNWLSPGPFIFNGTQLSAWDGQQQPASGRIQQVTHDGGPAMRFELRPGDPYLFSTDGTRAEVLWGGDSNGYKFTPGDDFYFGWSTWFDPNFPSPGTGGGTSNGHSLFVQWKDAGTGSPPVSIDTRNNVIQLGFSQTVTGGDCGGWNTPLVRGGWNDFVVRIKFSSTSGLVELWHRSPTEATMTKKISNCVMDTLRPGENSYLKQGYYRKQVDENNTGILWQRGMRVGNTYASVSP